ncbi:glycoside hydrolase family 3 N-terminal domain-containing protein [Arcticibacter tournemirensis]
MKRVLVCCTVLLLLADLFAQAQPNKPLQFIPKDTSWKKLSVRQKIGQTMLMLPDRKLELQLGEGSLSAYFKKYPVTGYFMGWKLWEGVKPEDWFTHIQKRCMEYQGASELPLLFQEDYESGVGIEGMTSFPNEMALGAANSPDLAYAYGETVAKECRSVGVSWVLHPVADINLNSLNPIVNVRSIGDDPDRAVKLLSRQVRGLQDHGVAATIKHFPGDGVDSRDQHLVTSCNSLPFEVWKQKHGKVFQALIDSGVACIMPGHITLPSYQKEKIKGFYPPATLSRELLTDLLKGEMGFKGVIVSDALIMGGFRGYYDDPLEGEVRSFMAGVDVMLWPSYRFMDTIEARIKRGVIPMQRLDDAVQRVWALKERLGLLDKGRTVVQPMSAREKQQAALTADNICERAVTLVRDRNHLLPLNPQKEQKILVVGVAPVGRKGGDSHLKNLKLFARSLGEKGFQVDFQHNILYESQGWTEDATNKYDRIIFAVARSPHSPFGPLQLSDDEAQSVWAINAMPKEKVLVVSFGNPYLINEYFERVNTCINAYSNTPVMHKAVIKALTGMISMRGVSPVALNNVPEPGSNIRIEIPLYPDGKIPNSISSALEEKTRDIGQGNKFIYNTTVPTITAYLPQAAALPVPAVIIFPGGGYAGVSVTAEGEKVAEAFNKMGVAAFVVKYRMPGDLTMADKRTGPLQDAQQAISLVRKGAEKWHIDPSRVGVVGFSAGGHLAATLCTHYRKNLTGQTGDASLLRPDFSVLVYPVISMTDSLTHAGSKKNLLGDKPSKKDVILYSNELQVDKHTPPSLLIHAGDDNAVNPENSIRYYQALRRNGVAAELIIYPGGGHGYGLENPTTSDLWIERCKDWMIANKWL